MLSTLARQRREFNVVSNVICLNKKEILIVSFERLKICAGRCMPCVELSKNKMLLAVPKKHLGFRVTLYAEWKLCVGATDWRTCQPFYPVRAEQHLFFSCWDPLNIIHVRTNVLLLFFGKQFRIVSVNTRVAYCVDLYT